MRRRKRIDSLQSLRALAFLGVFTVHCGVTPFGHWGVSVFFIMSGFLMMYSYCDKSLGSSIKECVWFGIKKIQSLYPLHIIMLVVAIIMKTVVLFSDFSDRQAVVDIGEVVLNLTLTQAWVPSEAIYFSYNGVAWYLSDCLFIYACFPFLLKIMKNYTVRKSLVVAILVFVFQIVCAYISRFVYIPISYVDNFQRWFTYIFPVFRLGDFVVGMCVGLIYINSKVDLKGSVATSLELLTIIIIILLHSPYAEQSSILGAEWFRYTNIFTITSAMLVWLFAINKGWISRKITCKPILYIASISAYGFLIHQMVIKLIDTASSQLSGHKLNKYLLCLSALFVTIMLSELYKKAEKKFRAK